MTDEAARVITGVAVVYGVGIVPAAAYLIGQSHRYKPLRRIITVTVTTLLWPVAAVVGCIMAVCSYCYWEGRNLI